MKTKFRALIFSALAAMVVMGSLFTSGQYARAAETGNIDIELFNRELSIFVSPFDNNISTAQINFNVPYWLDGELIGAYSFVINNSTSLKIDTVLCPFEFDVIYLDFVNDFTTEGAPHYSLYVYAAYANTIEIDLPLFSGAFGSELYITSINFLTIYDFETRDDLAGNAFFIVPNYNTIQKNKTCSAVGSKLAKLSGAPGYARALAGITAVNHIAAGSAYNSTAAVPEIFTATAEINSFKQAYSLQYSDVFNDLRVKIDNGYILFNGNYLLAVQPPVNDGMITIYITTDYNYQIEAGTNIDDLAIPEMEGYTDLVEFDRWVDLATGETIVEGTVITEEMQIVAAFREKPRTLWQMFLDLFLNRGARALRKARKTEAAAKSFLEIKPAPTLAEKMLKPFIAIGSFFKNVGNSIGSAFTRWQTYAITGALIIAGIFILLIILNNLPSKPKNGKSK